ncbi:hypothetical protein JW979_11060 [bacterium]|nr:hypothetical protein [candidate division CSSED10-310 bacterium]
MKKMAVVCFTAGLFCLLSASVPGELRVLDIGVIGPDGECPLDELESMIQKRLEWFGLSSEKYTVFKTRRNMLRVAFDSGDQIDGEWFRCIVTGQPNDFAVWRVLDEYDQANYVSPSEVLTYYKHRDTFLAETAPDILGEDHKQVYILDSKPILTAGDLKTIQKIQDSQGQPGIAFITNATGAQKLGDFASGNIGSQVAVTFRNYEFQGCSFPERIVYLATVHAPIQHSGMITGHFSSEQIVQAVVETKLAIRDDLTLPCLIRLTDADIIKK